MSESNQNMQNNSKSNNRSENTNSHYNNNSDRRRDNYYNNSNNNFNNRNRHFNRHNNNNHNYDDEENHRRNNNNNNYHNRSYQKSRQNNQRNNDLTNENKNDDDSAEAAKARLTERRKLLSMSSNSGAVNCICCLHDLHTFAYYSCMHFVCLNCAVKMRILCEKIDCPVCRQESKKVVCTKSEAQFKNLDEILDKCIKAPINSQVKNDQDTKAGIYFTDESIKNEYMNILANKCDICNQEFETFEDLDSHIRKLHRRFYCELCLDYLKLFPYERKHYNREELAFHKRNGDRNDYSFKGHPLCEYCDQRFFDRDELYRHYRKEHYYCHFCDTDGIEEYYASYAELRQHFLKSHYLCEIDGCSANGAETHEYVVFRTEIDFQAHKKQKHAKSKNEQKMLGKINIEFNVRESDNMGRYRRGGYGRGSGNQDSYNNRASNLNSDDHNYNNSGNNNYNNNSNNNNNERNINKKKKDTIDEDILRMSREQFQKDEDERLKKKQEEMMKKSKLTSIENNLETDPSISQAIAAAPPPPPSTTTSTWKNVIAGGVGSSSSLLPVNKDSEFPTLSGSNDGQGTFLSLSALGESLISMSSKQQKINKNTPWKSSNINNNNNNETKIENNRTKNMEVEKEELPKDNSNKKQKNKKNKKDKQNDESILNELKDVIEPKKEQDKKVSLPPSMEPPPGFIAKSESNAPTSTTSLLTSAPPGFESKKTPQNEKQNNVTKSQTQKETKEYIYIKPEKYDKRNEDLAIKLSQLFGHYNQSEFDSFKKTSMDFRKDNLNASEYLNECQKLLDLPLNNSDLYLNKKNIENRNLFMKFIDLIQEMIILLPDPEKQNELYEAFEKLYNRFSEYKPQQPSLATGWVKNLSSDKNTNDQFWFNIDNNLVKCDFCAQYFSSKEILFHQSQFHAKQSTNKQLKQQQIKPKVETSTLQDDFPALSTISAYSAEPVTKSTSDLFKKQPQPPKETAKITTSKLQEEEFPALSTSTISSENRFSTMPTAAIFSNPSAHLSLVKKKHRLQK